MVALLVAGVWAAVDLRNARVVGNTDADHSRVAGPMGHLLTASLLYEWLLTEVPRGIERADALFGLATTRPADPTTFPGCWRKRSSRRPATIGAPPGSWASGRRSLLSTRAGWRASRRARGARAGRASRRSHAARGGDRARGAGGDVHT